MKKILICGLGSIGQRHIRQIKRIYGNNFQLGAWRKRNKKILITDELEGISGRELDKEYDLEVFDNAQDAMNWCPDIVFVTNPISMHIDTALIAAEAGANIFIEKPLDCSAQKLEKLRLLLEKKRLHCMIGYQLRYHPGYKKVKDLVATNKLGKITFADFHFGEWLPGMHPYEDYRVSHASIRKQGGGVIFCLSHKIDLAYWIFGIPFSIYASGGKLSNLDIDVEDSVDIIFRYKNKKYNFPLHIHLDFIQKEKKCFVHVVGEKGEVYFDYCKNKIFLKINNGETINISYDGFERNDMFMKEIEDFFNCIKDQKTTPIPFSDGAEVLNLCLTSHRSLISERVELYK